MKYYQVGDCFSVSGFMLAAGLPLARQQVKENVKKSLHFSESCGKILKAIY